MISRRSSGGRRLDNAPKKVLSVHDRSVGMYDRANLQRHVEVFVFTDDPVVHKGSHIALKVSNILTPPVLPTALLISTKIHEYEPTISHQLGRTVQQDCFPVAVALFDEGSQSAPCAPTACTWLEMLPGLRLSQCIAVAENPRSTAPAAGWGGRTRWRTQIRRHPRSPAGSSLSRLRHG
jgi:hypothetical protein